MAPSAEHEGFVDHDPGRTASVVVVGAGPSGLMLAYVGILVLPIPVY